jgi:hypothetical protein
MIIIVVVEEAYPLSGRHSETGSPLLVAPILIVRLFVELSFREFLLKANDVALVRPGVQHDGLCWTMGLVAQNS